MLTALEFCAEKGNSLKSRAQHSRVELGNQIWVGWVAFATIALTATGSDPDLWGHVRFGMDWWKTRSLPTTDPYSFTQDRPWINHEWLSEALMGAAFMLGGALGLILLKIAVVGIALFVLSRRLHRATPLVVTAALSLVIILVTPISLTIRPHLWSVLGLVLLLALIDREEPPDLSRTAAGATLFALWANLHGGWITGAAVLAVYLITRVLRERRHVKPWIAFAAASAAGTLVNPYGLGLWRFLATTVRGSRPDIGEWAPLSLQSPMIHWVTLATVGVVAVALGRRAEARPKAEVWAVLLLLFAGAVRVGRVIPLVAPAALVLLAPYISLAWGQRGRLTVGRSAAANVFWIPAIVALGAAVAPATRALACIPLRGEWIPDLRTAPYLHGASGRLLTTFDWGEYAIWHFGPRLKVSIDGRRETVYSDSVVEWHRAFERGEPDAQLVVAKLAPDYVWLRSSRVAAKNWLLANGYRIDAESDAAFVAVRHDRDRLTSSLEPRRACFP